MVYHGHPIIIYNIILDIVIPFWWWYDHELLEHWIQGACVHVSLDLLHYCGDPTAWALCCLLQANRSFESIKRAAVATFDLLLFNSNLSPKIPKAIIIA